MPIQKFIEHLRYARRYTSHTVRAYRSDLEGFKGYLDERRIPVQGVNAPIIRAWIASLASRKLDNNSINRKLSSLKSFYRFLVEVKAIDENPALGIAKLKAHRKIHTVYSEEEMDKAVSGVFFQHLSRFARIRNRAIIETFYQTGMRLAELIGLQLKDVDLGADGFFLVWGKRNKARKIPTTTHLKSVLMRYRCERDHLKDETADSFFLTEKGNPLYPKLVYRLVNSQLSHVTTKAEKSPHVLRHTFATHLLQRGADLHSIKELLGHAGLAATQIYLQNDIENLKRMYNRAHPRGSKSKCHERMRTSR